MCFQLFDALVVLCGCDQSTSAMIDAACDRLDIGEDGRRRIAQAATRGCVDAEDLLGIIESAPGLIVDPGYVRSLGFPMMFGNLVQHIRLDA